MCDLGCGPGHIGDYLNARGVSVHGIDISPRMIAEARRLHPGLTLSVCDMLELPFGDATYDGAVAFYSLIHLKGEELARALAEIARILRPRGMLLVAVHAGRRIEHLDELWGVGVDLDFMFFEADPLTTALGEAGLTVERAVVRPHYPGVEAPTTRLYLVARKNA